MESQDKLVIISRYQEDLEWVRKLDCSILIYNKDDKEYNEFPNFQIPNIGRESETFIRGIIDNYDILNQFESITFLQGNPFEHCPDLYEKLEEKVLDYNFLSNNIQSYDLMSDLYINGTHLSIIHNLYGNQLFWNVIMEVTGVDFNFSKIFEQIYSLCEIMDIKYKGINYQWGHGAQYSVKPEFILSKSLNWWKELYRLLIYNYKNLNNQSFGYAMEKVWPLIWEHKT